MTPASDRDAKESDLLAHQSRLQDEAERIVELLQLHVLLHPIGKPIRVGSSAMGVMVSRDIDITVICEDLGPQTRAAFARIGTKLILMERHVQSVRLRNDTGSWNADPGTYPDGLYLGISARANNGADWNFDIWAVDEPERQPDLRHLQTLLPRLNDDLRKVILRIKQDLTTALYSETKIPSWQVYEAVIENSVGSTAQFMNWFASKRGST